MLKKCAVLGLVVLSLGGIALAWGYYGMQTQQLQPGRQMPPKGSIRSPEYAGKYGRWYELTPDEQTKLVLELDTDRRMKTPQQLAQEQQDRFRADIDKLAAGETVPSEVVTYLYGEDWQQEVTQYKEQMDQRRSVQAAAVICVSFGSGLFVLSILAMLGRLILRAIRDRRERRLVIESSAPATPSVPLQMEDGQFAPGPEIPGAESEMPDTETEPRPRKRAQRPSVAVEPLPVETGWGEESRFPMACGLDTSSLPQPATGTAVAVETLQDRAEDLQRQIAEFNTAAESVRQTVTEKSEPLNDTLKELTEQVSAIRDYASSQQDQMRRLQDGYDWGIIRTFCLRVIRCIDNIQGRIEELAAAGEPTAPMEEVRDELLFALESSGVEPFEPAFGSKYHGQEKSAEAIKQKDTSGRPDQAGSIAKVIRPGYRYVMDEENFKVVRTAQVMLFGCENE
jgi:molecular chaperone GrpE (heat shock protein)